MVEEATFTSFSGIKTDNEAALWDLAFLIAYKELVLMIENRLCAMCVLEFSGFNIGPSPSGS